MKHKMTDLVRRGDVVNLIQQALLDKEDDSLEYVLGMVIAFIEPAAATEAVDLSKRASVVFARAARARASELWEELSRLRESIRTAAKGTYGDHDGRSLVVSEAWLERLDKLLIGKPIPPATAPAVDNRTLARAVMQGWEHPGICTCNCSLTKGALRRDCRGCCEDDLVALLDQVTK